MRAMQNMAARAAKEIVRGSGASKFGPSKFSPDAVYWAIQVQVDISSGLGIDVMEIVDRPDQS